MRIAEIRKQRTFSDGAALPDVSWKEGQIDMVVSKGLVQSPRIPILAFFVATGVATGVGCTTELQVGTAAGLPVRSQIQMAGQTFADKDLPIRLVAIGDGAPMNTDEELAATRRLIIDSDAVVPEFDGVNASTLSFSTIKEQLNAAGPDADQPTVVDSIQSVVFPRLEKGQSVLEITWAKSTGAKFFSTCIYDETGIVYDNILSNIAFVAVSPVEAVGEPPPLLPAGEELSALPIVTQTRTLVDIRIEWAWPSASDRGRIRISHATESNGVDTIFSQNPMASCQMQLGSCRAAAQEAVFDTRQATMAFAWGWATPAASFRITFNAGRPPVGSSFEISTSGVGSKGVGYGTDTFVL